MTVHFALIIGHCPLASLVSPLLPPLPPCEFPLRRCVPDDIGLNTRDRDDKFPRRSCSLLVHCPLSEALPSDTDY